MTEISLEYEGKTRKLEISGHADYAEHGKDIVCSAVSCLAQTYLFYLRELERRGRAFVDSLIISEGYFKLYATMKSPEAEAAFEMLSCGLRSVSDSYPDNVKIF